MVHLPPVLASREVEWTAPVQAVPHVNTTPRFLHQTGQLRKEPSIIDLGKMFECSVPVHMELSATDWKQNEWLGRSISSSGTSKLSCCEPHYGEGHMVRNWSFSPTAREERWPANNQEIELSSGFSRLTGALRCLQPWPTSWNATHERLWAGSSQLGCSWLLNSQKLWEIINVCCLKSLCFGVIC